jgi:hypothetical protein
VVWTGFIWLRDRNQWKSPHGKPQGKGSLGILRPKYEDGFGNNLKGIRFESRFIWLRIGPSNGSCGDRNEQHKAGISLADVGLLHVVQCHSLL